MQKLSLLLLLSIFSFTSCAKKKWNKDAVVNDCLREFNKKNEEQPLFSGMEIPLLCDCVADKLLAKYSSLSESDKDKEGAQKIGMECAQDVLQKRK